MKNIYKRYTDFVGGMVYGMSQSGENFKQVDWKTVKEFIESNKEGLESVSVGLAEDWGHTSGEVWNSEDGYIPQEETYVYACSRWATPAFEAEYKDGKEETVECWIRGDDSDSYFE